MLFQAPHQVVQRLFFCFFFLNPPCGNSSHLKFRRRLLIKIWLWSLALREAFLHCRDPHSIETTMAGGSKGKTGRNPKIPLGDSVGNGNEILQVQLRLSFESPFASWGLEIKGSRKDSKTENPRWRCHQPLESEVTHRTGHPLHSQGKMPSSSSQRKRHWLSYKNYFEYHILRDADTQVQGPPRQHTSRPDWLSCSGSHKATFGIFPKPLNFVTIFISVWKKNSLFCSHWCPQLCT